MKRYENETGKPARIELKDANFQDYLKTRDEKFQRQWLGNKRYEMWKNGELTLEQMVNPDTGYRRNNEDLEKVLGKKITPAAAETSPSTPAQLPTVARDWQNNPTVQAELARNANQNTEQEKQFAEQYKESIKLKEKFKKKYPECFDRNGAIINKDELKDYDKKPELERKAIDDFYDKAYNLDTAYHKVKQRIKTNRKQNDVIFDALFPKLQTVTLTKEQEAIAERFTWFDKERKDFVKKMLKTMKSLGVDLDEWSENLSTRKITSALGSSGTWFDKSGQIKRAELEFNIDADVATIAHEFGHTIEKIIGKKTEDWFYSINKPTKKITDFSGIKRNKASYKDIGIDFPLDYGGYSQYTARVYGKGYIRSTELTSTFFQWLMTDAKHLLEKYPEFAKLILDGLDK